MAKTTKAGYAIAAHLGMDGDSFEDDYRYQSSRFTKPVYSVGDDLWGAGATPPKHIERPDWYEFEKVTSTYDGTTLWRCQGE